MKLETIRNNSSGQITVKGGTFVVTIRPDGYVTYFASDLNHMVIVDPKDLERVHRTHDNDVPSRSRPAIRRRGAR